MIEKNDLIKILAEFFVDSVREDAEDVDNWCIQGDVSISDTIRSIETYLNIKL